MKDIIIIGGGLAGLISAINLSRNGCKVFLIEKHQYPRHKVCGEYVSMEVYPYLRREDLLPVEDLPKINKLLISSNKGTYFKSNLQSGGFGLSRFLYEKFLYDRALQSGVEVIHDEAVDIRKDGHFHVELKKGTSLKSDLLICAYGKRSKLDRKMGRPFFLKRSPFVGIKFHAKASDHDPETIALHNFEGGYCGICNIENDITNFCYLVHRDKLKSAGGIDDLQQDVLRQNHLLASALDNAEMLYDKPLVINEISFETKGPVEDGMFMLGDSAGMITPLCGNGMAMAIHSAKLVSETIINNLPSTRNELLVEYDRVWREMFSSRLRWGRVIQRIFFGKNWASTTAVAIGNSIPPLTSYLIEKTHGKVIT